MAEWSELPSELLEVISNLSKSSSNTRHFRSVCSSWRSSVPCKPHTQIFSPTIKFLSSEAYHFDIRLVKQTISLLCLSSDTNSCWLIKTEEHKPGVFHLLSPFSKRNFIKPLECNVIDLTNVNIFDIGHEYVLRNVGGNDHVMNYLYNMEYEKVAFSFVGNNDVDNFILLSTHYSTGKLLVYRSFYQEWAFLDDYALGYDDGGDFVYDLSLCYVDVAEYDGWLYAVTNSGRTVIIEYGDDFSIVVTLMVKSMIGGDKKYLVKSGDELLLVDLYTCSVEGSLDVNAMDVFKLDKNEKRWVLLKSLGGRSIFLSNFTSFSTTSVHMQHGLKKNCIYFSLKNIGRDFSGKKDGNMHDIDGSYDEDGVESREIGVFDYEKSKFGSFEENFEESKFICWPPPPWINLKHN